MSRRVVGVAYLLVLACVQCARSESKHADPDTSAGRTAAGDSGSGNAQAGSGGSPSAGRANGGAPPASGGSSGSGGSGAAAGFASGGESAAGAGGTAGSSGASTGGSASGSGGNSAGSSGGEDDAGAGGSGELFPGDHCNFTVAHEQSSAIGTVTIINWSTDLPAVAEAHIDFGLADEDYSMTAPVELAPGGNRTLLLGMKAGRDYHFRIVANSDMQGCRSPEFAVTTAPLPANLPAITKNEQLPGGVEGYFLTTPGVGAGTRGLPAAYIFDTDGDVVWWTPLSHEQMASARMSWDGQAMWVCNANGGPLYRISMDGLDSQAFNGDATANHEVAPLPEGGVATFGRVNDDNAQALIKVADDGSVELIALLEDIYDTGTRDPHPNSVAYHPADDTFTVGDLNLNGYVKLKRNGELIWQVGGTNPLGRSFDLVGLELWSGSHGHDLGPNGEFLIFNNFPEAAGTRVVEVLLDEDDWTATKVWDYSHNTRSQYLGGTQRLPNGNTSVVISQGGIINEVNEAGEVVQSFDNFEFNEGREVSLYAVFGYAYYRQTLYGPPVSYWPE